MAVPSPPTCQVHQPFGLCLPVPEEDRTYYFFFSSARVRWWAEPTLMPLIPSRVSQERLAWQQAINTNADLLRQAPGRLSELVSLLPLLQPPALSSAERGVCKTALRRRFS